MAAAAADAADDPAASSDEPAPTPATSHSAEPQPARRHGPGAPGPIVDAEASRERVHVVNRRDGGLLFWLGRLYGFAAIVVIAGGALAGLLTYRYFSTTTPAAPDLRFYTASTPAVTRIYAADGTKLGEFAREWREVVPFDEIPQQLVDAVVSIEDHDFWHHGGLYYKGIARAAWTNLTAGDFAQGGSTITQQVAKQFLVSDKSLSRKAREAIMARRLEARYSKKAILSLYLNQIYLGAGAYGVAGAARRYFQKDLSQLTLAEMALIAGLPKAPSAFSPITQPERAIERRNVVLDAMVRWGKLSPDAAEQAKQEPLRLKVYKDVFPDREPYFAEHARRYVIKQYGEEALLAGGLRVETTAEPSFEAGAYENVDYGTRKQDKRQGWRGAEWFVDGSARETFIARQRERYGAGPLEPGRRYLAVVDDVSCDDAHVIVGDRHLELPLRNLSWAAPWSATNSENDREITCATRALRPGDVIWVSREIRTRGRYRDFYLPDKVNPAWRPAEDQHDWDDKHPDVVQLEQVPHPQGALLTADHRTGYVMAMVGGYDYARSELNRVVQSCRQPGSTYKPIYYSLGLDEGYGFDSMFYDRPVEIVDENTGEVWTPTNLNGTVDNDVSLEYALVFSKNIPSVELFSELGADNVEKWARRLGFTSEIIPDKALALGASCTYMDELTRAFAIFARNGTWIDWQFVRRILDRNGNVVEDHTVYYDPMLAPGERLDRLAATAGDRPREAIPTRAAFLTSKLLAQEVRFGFAKTLRATQLEAAGKTGTSSATMDTWFVAYTAHQVTSAWLGDDKRVRELGKQDAAYMTVVPLWARYMNEVAGGYPNLEIPWEVPPGIDPKDRGDHTRGRKGSPMSLVYRHAAKPEDEGGDGADGDGAGGTPPGGGA
ncbi:MAG TPA: transglycosylase domain-containing protein [Kofleriaceae bacterium]|nr:transglycosylase domain-containing protein [Kofleriaceae bacterium]